MDSTPLSSSQERVALKRFGFITRVEDALKAGNSLSAALRMAVAASEEPISPRTLEYWWYAYRKEGFGALHCKKRSDKGQARKCSPGQVRFILEQVHACPKIPLALLYRHWKEKDPLLPSLSTVYRVLQAHNLDPTERRQIAAAAATAGPTKAFEAPFANDLWMVDFSPGPFVPPHPGGKAQATHLCLILDDHSRLVPFARYYPRADTQSFHHTLKEAIRRRGLPLKLYTDQGGPFTCDHTKIICANLRIRLLHAKPYHAWSKGKVERMFRTIQQDFEAGLRLPGQTAGSLADLNERLCRWLEEVYHARVHSSTRMSPFERFSRQSHNLRSLPGEEDLERLFFMRLKRVVRKDGTIRLENRIFEVDLSLRGLEVEVLYDPFTLSRIEVYFGRQSFGLARLVNLHLNSQLSQSQNYEKSR